MNCLRESVEIADIHGDRMSSLKAKKAYEGPFAFKRRSGSPEPDDKLRLNCHTNSHRSTENRQILGEVWLKTRWRRGGGGADRIASEVKSQPK
jgi:hypothetical protein